RRMVGQKTPKFVALQHEVDTVLRRDDVCRTWLVVKQRQLTVESARTQPPQDQLFPIGRRQRDLYPTAGDHVKGRARIPAQVDDFALEEGPWSQARGQPVELGGRQVREEPHLRQELRVSAGDPSPASARVAY